MPFKSKAQMRKFYAMEAKGFDIDRLFSLGFGVYSIYSDLAAKLNKRWRSTQEIPDPKASEWILDSRTFLKNSHVSEDETHQLMLGMSTHPAQFRNHGP